MTTDPWLRDLAAAPHEPGLRRALFQLERQMKGLIGDEDKQSHQIIHDLKDELKTGANMVVEAGRRWAAQFFPGNEKIANYFDWDLDKDIQGILRTMQEAPHPRINEAVHEALRTGQHPQTVIGKLMRNYQIDQARDIARTVMMNIYAKGSLREMLRHGYDETIRMEINDSKRCPICEGLHTKRYIIADLLMVPDPLTEDSHPRCRGTFVPVINANLVRPDAKDIKHTETFTTASGKEIRKAPSEFAMFLRRFFGKADLPFDVVFDPRLPVDSRLGEKSLWIRPRALLDQDPRDIILEAWAHKLWPQYQDRFENEYLLMTKMGLVSPSKTVNAVKDYWTSEFVAYKTNALEQPFEILWFKTTVKE